ncbi:GDSL-type esterase/lipase family protein [Muricoccus aerilatus]|uniref:GDSL-type esterase/lipase family protein n=1 Tax=Muricoccus aerilatus TaxID=452982 RepID=UPI0009FF80C0
MDAKLGRRGLITRGAGGFVLCLTGKTLAQEPRPLRLLMLGDSITAAYGLSRGEGLPARLEAALRGKGRPVTVIDAGVSGDTTAGGRARLDWSLAEKPDAVIVALGGNDGLRAIEPRTSRANLAAILDTLKARGIPTMLAGMYAPPNLGADYGREFAGVYEALAREHPEAVFYPFLLEGVAGDSALNQPDGIHPNPRGVDEMVRRLLPAVETLLEKVRPA